MNKINKTEMTQCSPKSSTVLLPLSHLSASPTQTPLPPHVLDLPAWKSEAEEQICDAVTDESQNTSDAECSPEDSVVTKPSNPLSAFPMLTSPPRGIPDEPAWESEAEQRIQDVVSQDKNTSANERSPGGLTAEEVPIPSSTQ
jgi:hypothetical protein